MATTSGPSAPEQGQATRWSAGRVITVILGTLVALASAFGLVVGGTMLWLDQTQRDAAGFLTSDSVSMRSDRSARTAPTTPAPRRR